VQLDLLFKEEPLQRKREDVLVAGSRLVPVKFVRHRRAKHYILRVRDDGSVRLTVPWHGSKREALAFANTRLAWIEKQLNQSAERESDRRDWEHGTEILFQGEHSPLLVEDLPASTRISLAGRSFLVRGSGFSVREATQRFLWNLAKPELARRTFELAAAHRLEVRRVSVRNQRSRWGSCSANKTISLNWRLIQTSDDVRDYVIIHELMHLRQLNHSKRFWSLVEAACPDYREAERWLKENAGLLK